MVELPLEPVPVEPDALPVGGVALELVLPLPVLPLMLPVALPEVEPVPVAPIEDVPPLELGVLEVSVLALPVVVPLPLIEPVVDDGDVDEVEELVEGVPGVVVVVDDVLDSRLVQAPSERAAVTAKAAAVTWVKVIFIGKLLKSDSSSWRKRKGSRDCPEPTLGSPRLRSVGTGCNRV